MEQKPFSKNDLKKQFICNPVFRDRVLVTVSTCLNLIFALIKLTIGICEGSFWFIAIAVYYLCLWAVRSLILWAFEQKRLSIRAEYLIAILCGYCLLVLNAAFSGVAIQIIRSGYSYEYPQYLIVIIGCYAYYGLISSYWNLLRHKGEQHPLLAVSKTYTFANAMTTLMFMQTALFANYGENFVYKMELNIVSCCVLCFILTLMGCSIILRATHYYRIHKKENSAD